MTDSYDLNRLSLSLSAWSSMALHNKSGLHKKCGEGDFVDRTNRLVVANLSLRMSFLSG
jgi:hypothetical protein